MAELERRIGILEDVESIKELKSRYWRCVDKKLWDELADCFAEEGILDIPPRPKVQGRKAVAQRIAQGLGKKSIVTVHQGYNPEIDITSDTTAKGTWSFHDKIVDTEANTDFRGWGFYQDEYSKEDGRWKITSTRITRQLTETLKREG